MTRTIEDLYRLLDLTERDLDVYRGWTPESARSQVFGGQFAAQAVAAAMRTVSASNFLHSLHSHFLRRGDPNLPIDYAVETVRDGRTLSVRNVVAHQREHMVFSAVCSFRADSRAGAQFEHQESMPAAPDPYSLPSLTDRIEEDPQAWIAGMREWGGFDVRWVGDPREAGRATTPPDTRTQIWARAVGSMPDDPFLHTGGLVYLSDISMLSAIRRAHGVSQNDPTIRVTSIDHTMWLHCLTRLDEFLLYDQYCPRGSRNLTLAQGRIFSHDGTLVASVAQQGIITRVATPPSDNGTPPQDAQAQRCPEAVTDGPS